MLAGFTALAAPAPTPPSHVAAQECGTPPNGQGVVLAGGLPGSGPCPPMCQLSSKFCLFGTPLCKCLCIDGSEVGYEDCSRWFPNDCRFGFW